jgi:hypothetical protein
MLRPSIFQADPKAGGGTVWNQVFLYFCVPGRIPREPRLNPSSGLPKHITAQISPTNIEKGGYDIIPANLRIGKIIVPAINVITKKPNAHKMMNIALFMLPI